jgi:L-threonylcarbamoyladenylate synthase
LRGIFDSADPSAFLKPAAALEKAVQILISGGVIIYPTETFYALGAKFDCDAALEKISRLKGRPADKPFPLIIPLAASAGALALNIDDKSKELMETFWPGPLTIFFKAVPGLSPFIRSKDGITAMRVPGESFALKMIRAAGFPVTATSANPSGLPPAQDAETALEYFNGAVDLIVDGGKTPGGAPSTMVKVVDGRVVVVRVGAIKL